jgi:hypothetical protein
VQRVLAAARQVEGNLVESGLGQTGRLGREDGGALVRAARAVLLFRRIMTGTHGGQLGRVNLVKSLRGRIVEDGEERVREWARKVVREFNISNLTSPSGAVGGPSFKDAEEARKRFESACHVLYLLSPAPEVEGRKMKKEEFEPELLLRALLGYVHTAVQSSAGGIARGLATLPQLDRALVEASSRCQSVVGMEKVLRETRVPEHPTLDDGEGPGEGQEEPDEDEADSRGNLLEPLLHALDTASLPSYFWRSLASQLGPRVQEIMSRGGVSARTLRSNRDRVRDEIRECVLRGSRMSTGVTAGEAMMAGNWEREAAVMVGSVMGPLGR